jgi:calcineurin-like phosphoesterase family protein
MIVWFTSDQHWGHANVIRYTNRPFTTADEMGETFIENWNKSVKPGDMVYHLGDFAFLKPDAVPNLVKRLHGQIHLIRGNHDRFLKDKHREYGFAWIGEYREIKIADQKAILCHYPFMTWNGRHHGSWDLHGHSHGSLPKDMMSKRLDIGVDAVADLLSLDGIRHPMDYRPISYDEVAAQMEKRGIGIVDGHEARKDEE